MTANTCKCYLGCLKLVDKCNDTYHRSVGKKPSEWYWLFCFDWRNWGDSTSSKSKIGVRVRNAKYKQIYSKVYTENLSRECF